MARSASPVRALTVSPLDTRSQAVAGARRGSRSGTPPMRRPLDTRSPVVAGAQPGSCSRPAATRWSLGTRAEGAAGAVQVRLRVGASVAGTRDAGRDRRREGDPQHREGDPGSSVGGDGSRGASGSRMVWPTRMPAPPRVGGSVSSLAQHGLGDQVGRPCVVASRQDREYTSTSTKKILVDLVFMTSGPCEPDAGWTAELTRALRFGGESFGGRTSSVFPSQYAACAALRQPVRRYSPDKCCRAVVSLMPSS